MSWFDEAKKLAAATILVMEHIDPATADMRMATCRACDKMDREHVKCSVCGCYLEAKTWSKVSRSKNRPLGELTHCPLGKWHDTQVANHYRAEDGLWPLGTEAPKPSPDIDDTFFY